MNARSLSEAGAAASRPRVTMLVRNPFTNDTRVEKEAGSLARAGYAVTIVADAGPSLPPTETREEGISVVRVGRPLGRVPVVRFLAGEVARVRTIMATRPEILHSHDSNALVPIWLAAARLRRPFVYDAHDLWLGRPRRQRSRLYFWLNQQWYGLIERMLVPRAAGWVTVSRPIADLLARKYRLPEVVLVENFPPAELARDETRLPLRVLEGADPIPDEAPIVLYVGGLMAGRGIEHVVEAMSDLPAAHLVLLGEGQLGEALNRLAARLGVGARVHRLGPVPSGDVVRYARSADVGVSPIVPSCLNYRYSLPNKLFQYMAAGIPVVASDLPQVREVVETAQAGVIVDTREPAAIAGALAALLSDAGRAGTLGGQGRRAVLDRFNWEHAEDRLLEVYRRIVPAKASAK